MILDSINAEMIAAKFGNKWAEVQYCGCWGSNSISFAMYQDKTERAGFELIIERPKGDYLTEVKVIKVKRISVTEYGGGKLLRKYKLPLLIV